jgi:hypothetical protein
MARAHHDAGDHASAKRALLKALHLAPSDIKIRFNLAFVLQVGLIIMAATCVYHLFWQKAEPLLFLRPHHVKRE